MIRRSRSPGFPESRKWNDSRCLSIGVYFEHQARGLDLQRLAAARGTPKPRTSRSLPDTRTPECGSSS